MCQTPLSFSIIWILILFIVRSTDTNSQCLNLVPNGSFENFSTIPNSDCDWSLATGWNNAATSSNCSTTNGTPDYFHLLGQGPFSSLPSNYFADINPFEGSAVMGLSGTISFVPNFREYISISLLSPLEIGQTYTMSYSLAVGRPNVGGLYADGWGASLSIGALLQSPGTSDVIPISNQEFLVPNVFDRQDWQTFSFTFVADQAYDTFTFGNFFSSSIQTTVPFGVQPTLSIAYVFVDDISIRVETTAPLAVVINDYISCPGEEVVVDAQVTGGQEPYFFSWNPNISSNTNPVVLSPNESTSYTLVVTDCTGNTSSASFEIIIDVINTTDIQTACDNFTWIDGIDYQASTNSPFVVLTSTSGCDSIVTLNLTINNSTSGVDVQTACNTFTWIDGVTYNTSINGPTFTLRNNAGCDSTLTLNLTIIDALDAIISDVNLGEDQFLCAENLVLDATTFGAQFYLWSDGSTSQQIVISRPGVYFVQVANICFTSSDTITIFQGFSPLPPFEEFAIYCASDSVLIGPVLAITDIIVWDDGFIGSPRFVSQEGIYTINFIGPCETRSSFIEVEEDPCLSCDAYIPNAFSPNSDGINDVFSPLTSCPFEQYECQIFDRWGNAIYKATSINDKWDGTKRGSKCEPGVYVYLIKYKFEGDQARQVSGEVTLLK